MKLTPCSAPKCINLTYDTFSEYGTFCFLHSRLSFEPNVLVKEEEDTNSVTQRVILMNTKVPTILEINEPTKLVPSEVRRAPVPKSGYSKLKVECCICTEKNPAEKKMKCGHLLCEECLDMIKTTDCPECNEKIEGEFITEEMLNDIKYREQENNNEPFIGILDDIDIA